MDDKWRKVIWKFLDLNWDIPNEGGLKNRLKIIDHCSSLLSDAFSFSRSESLDIAIEFLREKSIIE